MTSPMLTGTPYPPNVRAAFKELEATTSPGPWDFKATADPREYTLSDAEGHVIGTFRSTFSGRQASDNVAFVVGARSHLVPLANEVGRLQAALAVAEAAVGLATAPPAAGAITGGEQLELFRG